MSASQTSPPAPAPFWSSHFASPHDMHSVLRLALLKRDPFAMLRMGVIAAPADATAAIICFEAALAAGGGEAAPAALRREAWFQAAMVHLATERPEQAVGCLQQSLRGGASVVAARMMGLCLLRGRGTRRCASGDNY